MSTKIDSGITRKIIKKPLLLLEKNVGIQAELSQILDPFYHVVKCSSFEEAIKKLDKCSPDNIIITNTSLHEEDHSLMNGFSIVRYSQFREAPTSVILYTNDLNPLAILESQKFGAYKILDLSHPDFKKVLLETVSFAIKIADWRSQFISKIKNALKVREMLQEIKFVQPILWNYDSENIYNCFFETYSTDPFCYANNWAYICQAARNNGHKFFNGSCLITIATETTNDLKDISFILINPIGQSAVKWSLQLAEQLRNISGNRVILKKLTRNQERHFLRSGKCHLVKPKSNKLEDQYDDIYPQIVINLKAFIHHLTSSRLSDFRRNLTKFSQRNHTMRTIKPELFDDFWDVVLRWKRSFINRYEAHREFTDIPQDNEFYINPYFPIFDYYSKYVDNRNTLFNIVYVDSIPVGLSFLSRVSNSCMGMYANIADTEFEGLSEFMLYNNLTKAYWSGYKYVNLGGTESKYLYEFYKKFKLDFNNENSIEIKTNYLIYD